MAETSASSPKPARKRGWLRALIWGLGIFIVLVVVGYFVATSSAFVKGVILPKASAALNAKITAGEASISPFHQVVLKDLKVQTTGTEPLLTAAEVRLRYSLMQIVRGNIKVDEITVNSPVITLVENPDGTSNLDPILKAQQQPQAPAKPETPSQPSKPLQLDINKIAVNNGTFRQEKLYAGGKRDVAELSNLNLTLDHLQNGQTAKLGLAANINLQQNPPAPSVSGVLQGSVKGNFELGLTKDLQPGAVQGNLGLSVTRAEGALAEVAGLGANLDCNITPTDIKQVALRFQKGDSRLGELLVSGPFDLQKLEGRVSVQVLNIDKNLLDLAAAGSGLSFGPTTVNSTNQIELAKSGSLITVIGQFNLDKLEVTRASQTTPSLDLHAAYNLSLDRAASNAVVRTLTLSGVQKQNQFLRGELTSPMTIAWGKANTSADLGNSSLNVTVSHLNLADWNAFVGDVAPAGDVNARLQLLSQAGGKQLSFDASAQILNLTAIAGSNRLAGADVNLQIKGQAADLERFTFPQYSLQVAKQNQPLVTLAGSGSYDKTNSNAEAQLEGKVMLAALLQAFPQADLAAASGTAELKAHVLQKGTDQAVTGSLSLADFTGRFGSNVFNRYGATADFDVGLTPALANIRKLSGKVTAGMTEGGAFDLSGTYGLSNSVAQLTARLANFNQAGLAPFLQPALGDRKLASVALNANASVQYDPKAASAVKADLAVTNLVVNDPSGQIPATPLEARAQLDATLNQKVAELRQCVLGLTPTPRGSNQVQVTGRVDMSDTNAIQGNLKLAADSLDLTTYYDLFAGKPAEANAPSGAATPAPAAQPAGSPGSSPESAPTNSLPVRDFVTELAIGRLFVHELQITNWQTAVRINGGHVIVNPCQLAINGAPVSAAVDLNMAVPGYKYDVSANAKAIPLQPLVDSLKPEYKGLLKGTLSAEAKVNGIGTTGAALQKTLAGQYDLFSTNLNLSVDSIPNNGIYTRLLKTLVTAIAIVPDIAKNPTAATGLVSGLVGLGSSAGGLSGDLKKSPIDSIVLRGSMGSGKVVLQEGIVQSPTFIAGAQGTVDLAPVLTNSPINIPVSVSLERNVAQRINLVPPNTPPTDSYVKLPDYLTITGTLGDPKNKINYAAFAGTTLQSLSGLAGKNSGLVQGLGNILGGSGSANQTGGTNKGGNKNLLQGLGGLLGGGAAPGTNQPPSTNAPPPANQNPVDNLLNNFLKRGK